MIFLKNFWGLAKPVFHTNIYIWNISWITNIIIVHLLEMFRHNRSFLVLKVYYLFVAAFLTYKFRDPKQHDKFDNSTKRGPILI